MVGRRNITFVTGTRAEFGLMTTALAAIRAHSQLRLTIVATGMHLDRTLGHSVDDMAAAGFPPDVTVPWPRSTEPTKLTQSTGRAIAGLAAAYQKLQSDVVLVTGDRVEAFAAASAAHLCRVPLAHVHGGDRALGQVDDALRHAITKLANLHFPATADSARRIESLGEPKGSIHTVGSPGNDRIRSLAAPFAELKRQYPVLRPHRYALLLLHPTTEDDGLEYAAANLVLDAVRSAGVPHVVVIHPNNDPGSPGILRAWSERNAHAIQIKNGSRPLFLSLLRHAAVLVGNSSSGIIEAASLNTMVIDVGDRQLGRPHSDNVIHAPFDRAALRRALARVWRDGSALRYGGRNIYGAGGAGRRIAAALARVPLDALRKPKLITY